MKAAILTKFNEPLEIREIEWAKPSYGQVLVRVIASGICGAQIAEIRGDKNHSAPVPRPLGHEAVVRIIECGEGVTKVKENQKAIAHWRKGDGCEALFPQWSFPQENREPSLARYSGHITTFSTHSVISETRLTPVPEDTPDELCCLLGCSLSTALGTIENEANVRFGESALIIGCGGLGLNLILAAKLRQASEIVATDTKPEKKEMAIAIGATRFSDFPSSIRGSFDVVIDTTGNDNVIAAGILRMAPSGRFIMVGQPKRDVVIPDAVRMFEGNGKTITATQGGRFSPTTDIPRYISMWRAGRLNLDGLISHRLPLLKINEGLDLVRNGMAGRVLIDCASNE